MASVLTKRTARGALFGSLTALVLTLSGLGAPAASSADIPGKDEIAMSPNMRLVTNIPKQGPFAAASAYNSDLAFQGRYAFAGNYEGFVVYDISRPEQPEIVSQVHCPGSQNDVSVAGNLLFLSTDSSRSDDSCQSTSKPVTDPTAWEGIKIFDISDVRNPRYVKAIETECGSHTHTLLPGRRGEMYVYVSSYLPAVPSTGTGPDCREPHDKISVIKVPLKRPQAAAVVAEPVLFPDGGNPGDGLPYPEVTRATSGCHDLTTYPDKDLMAGACMGDGVLFDVSDPEEPRIVDIVRDDENFSFWHSATFNNDADKIVFTDELGGGSTATCNATIGPDKGADAIYDIVGKGRKAKLEFRSYYKIPRANADTENCVAHNGSLIPVKGKDIMVQAWYQGGISVWDFTDSRNPKEIGWFERGPFGDTLSPLGGSWSAYYYNGYIYSNDIQKGLDVLKIEDKRTDKAERVRMDELNVQMQPDYFD
ncbi:LVIVD repeat-containing protein [Thermomonospora amylolytica]|uniref:LVIVD repeat-containing protein n=1 Tax=Thermomonospora amylolytica TaxID=1411117 RepID=UPI00389A071C